jgi:hypothetical protein
MKKELHKLRDVMPDMDLRRAVKLRTELEAAGLWRYVGDPR